MINANLPAVIKLGTLSKVSFLLPSCNKHQNCASLAPVFRHPNLLSNDQLKKTRLQTDHWPSYVFLLFRFSSFVSIACLMIDNITKLQVNQANHPRSRKLLDDCILNSYFQHTSQYKYTTCLSSQSNLQRSYKREPGISIHTVTVTSET